MRAYVVLTRIDDPECHPEIVGLTSSRNSAIHACERSLEQVTENTLSKDSPLKWVSKEKHRGFARKGDHTAEFSMHFINDFSTTD